MLEIRLAQSLSDTRAAPTRIVEAQLLLETQRANAWLGLDESLFIGRGGECFYEQGFGVVLDTEHVADLAQHEGLSVNETWHATVFALVHEFAHAYHHAHSLDADLGMIHEAHSDFVAGLYVGWWLPEGALSIGPVCQVAFACGRPMSATHPSSQQREHIVARAVANGAWLAFINSMETTQLAHAGLTEGELDNFLLGHSWEDAQRLLDGSDSLHTF